MYKDKEGTVHERSLTRNVISSDDIADLNQKQYSEYVVAVGVSKDTYIQGGV